MYHRNQRNRRLESQLRDIRGCALTFRGVVSPRCRVASALFFYLAQPVSLSELAWSRAALAMVKSQPANKRQTQ